MTATVTVIERGQRLRRELMASHAALKVFVADATARRDAEALAQLEQHERELFDALQSLQDVR